MQVSPPGIAPVRVTMSGPRVGWVSALANSLAVLSLLGLVAATLFMVIPVKVAGVQDCGAPGAYLREGRVDIYPDEQNQILSKTNKVIKLDPKVAQEARDSPCQERVANRAVPAAKLGVAAIAVGIVAIAVQFLIVRRRQRKALIEG